MKKTRSAEVIRKALLEYAKVSCVITDEEERKKWVELLDVAGIDYTVENGWYLVK